MFSKKTFSSSEMEAVHNNMRRLTPASYTWSKTESADGELGLTIYNEVNTVDYSDALLNPDIICLWNDSKLTSFLTGFWGLTNLSLPVIDMRNLTFYLVGAINRGRQLNYSKDQLAYISKINGSDLARIADTMVSLDRVGILVFILTRLTVKYNTNIRTGGLLSSTNNSPTYDEFSKLSGRQAYMISKYFFNGISVIPGYNVHLFPTYIFITIMFSLLYSSNPAYMKQVFEVLKSVDSTNFLAAYAQYKVLPGIVQGQPIGKYTEEGFYGGLRAAIDRLRMTKPTMSLPNPQEYSTITDFVKAFDAARSQYTLLEIMYSYSLDTGFNVNDLRGYAELLYKEYNILYSKWRVVYRNCGSLSYGYGLVDKYICFTLEEVQTLLNDPSRSVPGGSAIDPVTEELFTQFSIESVQQLRQLI